MMNLTTMAADDMYDDVINGTAASNASSIYFSVKSNNSEFADCSQTILMDEIKVSERGGARNFVRKEFVRMLRSRTCVDKCL